VRACPAGNRTQVKDRLDGLCDVPRPRAARTIGDDVIEAVVVETLESAPPDATHGSTRTLATRHGTSHTTVREFWRSFKLKPWREDSFKVSPDPNLVEKIRDLVGLYMSLPMAAVVFAIEEKAQIQAGITPPNGMARSRGGCTDGVPLN